MNSYFKESHYTSFLTHVWREVMVDMLQILLIGRA